MATSSSEVFAKLEGAGNYGIKIAKSGHDVTEEDRYLIFNSKRPCLKILQTGKVRADLGYSVEVDFAPVVAFPIVVLLFLYDASDQQHKPISPDFDSTKLYLPAGGEALGSYYYYFICYA